jgi:PASTA domain
VPEPVTWYDVLGVTCGASAVTLRRAHDERLQLLRAYFAASARTASVPVPATPTVATHTIATPTAATPLTDASSLVIGAASRAAAAVEAAWLVLGDSEQRRRYDARLGLQLTVPPGRRLTVPDVRGLFYRSSQAVAAMAGLRLTVIRLTADPLPVEGLVVGQSPDPGETVKHRSRLTIQVWHPARNR